jgi:hypothetical protein
LKVIGVARFAAQCRQALWVVFEHDMLNKVKFLQDGIFTDKINTSR